MISGWVGNAFSAVLGLLKRFSGCWLLRGQPCWGNQELSFSEFGFKVAYVCL